MGLRVATKYPRIADSHFASRGAQVRIISLNGSIELAPLLDLSDCILDIVQTGTTLEANGLVVLDEVAPVSLRLVASRRSAQLRWQEIAPLLEKLDAIREETL
jgi:ATP phosphoribosyltransferase